jgi:hypothetical protein
MPESAAPEAVHSHNLRHFVLAGSPWETGPAALPVRSGSTAQPILDVSTGTHGDASQFCRLCTSARSLDSETIVRRL